MEVQLLLSLPKGLEVTNIDVTDGILTVTAMSTQQSVCCPLCSSPAARVHSHYTRTAADLPCAGQEVAPTGAGRIASWEIGSPSLLTLLGNFFRLRCKVSGKPRGVWEPVHLHRAMPLHAPD
jgi:hypothetical protein